MATAGIRPTVPDPAQLEAADPGASAWVAANAGTGKTRVLVDRVARLLLRGTPPQHILCLTFTRAAAAEMANRLSERLGHWTVTGDRDLTLELELLTGEEGKGHDLAAARRLFAQTLEAPGGMNIRTIHSFCQSLLGRFPVEAGVAPHFSVIDDRTSQELLEGARDRVLRQAADGKSPDLARALDTIAGLIDERGFDDLVSELIANRGRLERLMRHHGSVESAIAAARDALGLEAHDSEATVLATAAADDAFDGQSLRRALEALEEGSKTDGERAAGIRDWLRGGEDHRVATFRKDYARWFLTNEDEPRKRLATKKVLKADPDTADILVAEQERVLGVVDRLKAVYTVGATAVLLRLAGALLDAYRMLKERRALLDYDDLILTARDLLASHVSWVHYKLDGGLDHILVDEAQDTSPEQWEIVASLAEEFFAGAGAREGPRTVFAVGDETQSIVSFQGADPEEFARMRTHFAERARNAGTHWCEVPMPRSFRSVPKVLEAVDRVFAGQPASDGLTADGAPPGHVAAREGQAGLVEVWPLLEPADEPDGSPWDAPLDSLPATSPATRLAERMAACIRHWLDSGERLQAEDRPIRPEDIMILVRRRGQFSEEVVRCLKRRDIPVAGSDRMVLGDQMAVMDLVALGRFVLLPEDQLNLAAVLKGPLMGFDDDALFDLARDRREGLWRTLKGRRGERPLFETACAELSALLDRADFTPPYEFYADLLARRGGRRKLLARLGPDAGDPIDEFLSLALFYERDHVPSLQGFLHWLEAAPTNIKRDLEQARDTVRVLTVHGAKGLQANIVFLPDTCAVPGGRHDPRILLDDREEPFLIWPPHKESREAVAGSLRDQAALRRLREYRRLLYVAMTRARDRLYICGWETRKGRGKDCWYDLVAEALGGEGEKTTLFDGQEGWRLEGPQTAEPDGRAKEPASAGEAPELPDWARLPAPAEPEPSRPLAPSRPTDDEPCVRSPLGADDGARYRRGALIHGLLENLPELPPERRPDAARAFLSRPLLGLSPEEQAEIAGQVLAVLGDPAFADLFGPGSRAEVPAVGEISGRVVSARFDRLVVTAKAVTVVDYKTNRPPPENENEVPPLYLDQMAAYRELLRRVYPGLPVRCLLLWTDAPRLMDLGDDLLDRHAP